jgi:hypothetical protein
MGRWGEGEMAQKGWVRPTWVSFLQVLIFFFLSMSSTDTDRLQVHPEPEPSREEKIGHNM